MPDAEFEIAPETVRGVMLPVFQDRPRALIEVLLAAGAARDKDYLIQGERRLSYGAHSESVIHAAKKLRAEYKIGRGDRVVVFAANSIEWVVMFWACQYIGAVFVAFNRWWTDAETNDALTLIEPMQVFCDAARQQRIPRVKTLNLQECLEDCFENRSDLDTKEWSPAEVKEDDPALILFTSGTTGKPRGVVSSHRGQIGFLHTNRYNTVQGCRQYGIDPASLPPPVTLGSSPFFHNSGLGGNILMTLYNGGTLVIPEGRFDPATTLELIERERITTWTVLGGMGPRILACPQLAGADTSSVTTLSFGGAAITESVQKGLRAAFPNAASNQAIGYGMTETVSAPASFGGAEFLQHPLATGRVSLLHELEVRDEAGIKLPNGQEGRIYVRSPYVMLGYWRDPAATSATLSDDLWVDTGDIGKLVDGLLTINARARDMIIRSAENISPTEIENRIDAHPQVRECAVFGVDDPIHGQAVKAVVVQSDSRPDISELKNWVAEVLSPYKVPEHWEVRPEPLPRNAAGKVIKAALQ